MSVCVVRLVRIGPLAGTGRPDLRDRDGQERGRGDQRVAQVQRVRVVGLFGSSSAAAAVGQYAAGQDFGRTALGTAAGSRIRHRICVHRRTTLRNKRKQIR